MPNPNPTNFTGFPYGLSAPGVGMMAMTAPLALPQTATKTIYTITGGPIRVLKIFGLVTTAIGAVANATKLTATPTIGGAATDICATADLNAAAAGDLLLTAPSFATGLSIITAGVGPVAASTLFNAFIMTPGTILVNCAGSDGGTGRIQWFMHYEPLSVGIAQAGLVQVTMPLS